jgi:predicted transcriptional regulator
MTMTVKFPPELESGLRRYAAATGVPASVVIREAVAQYLTQAPAAQPSAHALGAGLFGKHAGPADLATTRKAAAAEVWADKQARRGR